MTPKLIFAGDLHLSRTIYTSHPRMRGDSYYALQQIAELCHANGTGLVLCGDNFDKRFPEPDVIRRMLVAIRDLDVAYVQGQHDMHQLPWLAIDSSPGARKRVWLDAAEKESYEMNGVRLWGMDCRPRDAGEEFIKENFPTNEVDVAVVHQLFLDVLGEDLPWTMDPRWFPLPADGGPEMIIAGDWHGENQAGDADGRSWFYTGSSTMRSINEPTQKSVIVLGEEDGKFKVERLPLNSRPFLYFLAETADELAEGCADFKNRVDSATAQAANSGVPEDVRTPMLVLRYDADLEGAQETIHHYTKDLLEKNAVILHPMPFRRASIGDEGMREISTQVNVQAAIDSLVDPELAPELHSLVSDLAVAPDPKERVTDFKHKREIYDVT